MPGSDDPTSKFEKLRQQATEVLQRQPEPGAPISEDMLGLIHELRVHHAELEIQNDELRKVQLELSELYQEYERLYEFAPCGYVTLNPKGIILRANLTAVKLLGAQKVPLHHIGFSQFIDPDYVGIFIEARRMCGRKRQRQYVEVPLKTGNNGPTWVRIDISADCADNGRVLQWSMTLIDITDKRKAEAELQELHNDLKLRVVERTESLSQTNEALKALLDLREIEKKTIEQTMLNNLRRYVYPYLDELDMHDFGSDVNRLTKIIRSNIEELIAPAAKSLSVAYANFTQTEIKVADLVRQGESNKSIARYLYISVSTVEKHRNKIRKKLGILNKKVNLYAHLKSLT